VLSLYFLASCGPRRVGAQSPTYSIIYTATALSIDFGFEDGSSCVDGNSVVLTTNGDDIEATIIEGNGTPFVVNVNKVFKDVIIKMSDCQDTVTVLTTHDIEGTIDISMGGGSDTVIIGDAVSGVEQIFKGMNLSGGSGDDTLHVDDAAGVNSKLDNVMTPGTIMGLLNGPNAISSDIQYGSFEFINIDLSQGANSFTIPSTAQGSVTSFTSQGMDDTFVVNETMGDLNIDTGDGNDKLYFYGLGEHMVANIRGGNGNDIIWVDGTKDFSTDPPLNTLSDSRLRWSGGGGDDTMHFYLSSIGNSNIDIFDDLDGVNDINIDCGQVACYMLSRENFLASIHNMSDPNTTMERVNLVRNSAGENTASINTVVLRLNGGENQMFFDDTFASMEVFGGPLVDSKYQTKSF